MDEPIQRFVREVARKDPETALTWAQSITDEERRKKVEADVMNIKVVQAQREQAEASGTHLTLREIVDHVAVLPMLPKKISFFWEQIDTLIYYSV